MGKTSIEWTATQRGGGSWAPGYTFNPWWGCVKVSPGCEHCYAETLAKRYGHLVWGPAKTTRRRLMSESYWRQPLKWNRDAEHAGERRRVFCASMADVFEEHPQLPPLRARLWDLIEQTPALDWLLLTKRPENIRRMLPAAWLSRPRSNVWLGASAENQEVFDRRVDLLLSTPSVVHFLSIEPMLGPIELRGRRPSWIICGGESGSGARPMHPDWARSLRDQCRAAGVAFHFKQWGEWLPMVCERDGNMQGQWIGANGRRLYIPDLLAHAHEIAHDQGIVRLGKKTAGRLLDGRTWDEFPDTAQNVLQGPWEARSATERSQVED